MARIVVVPVIALTLVLAACASRPPEPTADMSGVSTAQPATGAGTVAADRGTVAGGTPAGTNVASSANSADRSVFFEFDSSSLSPQAQGIVQQNARVMQPRNPKVRLEGNADDRGSREYNLALGQRRAEAVRQAMVLSGLRADSLEAISYGEERPRCTDEVEECRATNRRVDILSAP